MVDSSVNYQLTTSQKVVAALADYVHSLELLSLIAVVDFECEINEEVLLEAISKTAKRLPYCNVRFRRLEDGSVVQYSCEEEPEPVEVVDFTLESEEEQEEQFREWNSEAFPGNFENIQLYQFKLLRYPDGHHGLFFAFQHFIMDGYAGIYTLHYLSKVYIALLRGKELPAPGPEPWKLVEDDIAYHASPRYQKGLEKLSAQYETEPCFASLNGRGAPEFIEDKRYGRSQNFSQFGGSVIRHPLSPVLSKRIENEAKRLNISAQNFYLLALRSYLGRVSETDDVTVITLLACRSTLFEKQCGLNTADAQLVRSIIPDSCSFGDAVLKLADIQNEELRYAKVINNDILRILRNRFDVPQDCTYAPAWMSFFPAVTFEEGQLDLTVRFISNGWATSPFYMLVLPDSNRGTQSATYWYAVGYTFPESIERFHAFMLKFLEKGIGQPDRTLGELIDESL